MATKDERASKIAALNDALRTTLQGGRIMITAGVHAEGPVFLHFATAAMRGFTDFTEGDDPYGEHDFGVLWIENVRLYWKIDYFQKGSNYSAGAEHPENAETTDRVLTLMLADEY